MPSLLEAIREDIRALRAQLDRIERRQKRIERAIPLLARVSEDATIRKEGEDFKWRALGDLRSRRVG